MGNNQGLCSGEFAIPVVCAVQRLLRRGTS